jgi:hypothetical protein
MEIKFVTSRDTVASFGTFDGTRDEFLDLEWIDSQPIQGLQIDIARPIALQDVIAQNPTGLVLFENFTKFWFEGEVNWKSELFWIEEGEVLKSEVTNA